MNQTKKISIVIPVFNEEEILGELHRKITEVMRDQLGSYEVIFINDGSMDKSFKVLREMAFTDKKVKVINFARNFGQTAAIAAGINNAVGDIIIPMDADLENDPADIPRLLKKLDEGYDVVSGWRRRRWVDKFWTRKLPSALANWLISRITKIKLHDYGCTLKAYRREVIEGAHLYGEMHRFIPVYASLGGAKIAEMEVNYQPRKHGKSSYGLGRILKVLLDLFTVTFLLKYFTRPMHFFGKFGAYSLFLGFLSGSYAILRKLVYGSSFIDTPLPLLTVVLGIIGIQFILMGLLAEILIRIYYESNNKKAYIVKEKINF